MQKLFYLFLVFIGISSVQAQAHWTVQSLIPEVVSIRVPTTNIVFGITQDNYPPETFPHQYPATSPQGGVLPVQVFSNAEGAWSLTLEIPGFEQRGSGLHRIEANQIMYRVNNGVWLRANGSSQIIYNGSGKTTNWQEIRIQFALELTGKETAGSYAINATVAALQDNSGF